MKTHYGPIHLILSLLLFTACTPRETPKDAERASCNLTLEQLEQSLGPAPLNVGFDFDDTLFFSSPGFYYGMHNRDGANGKNRYPYPALKSDEFWRDMNSRWDAFSIPTQIGRELMALHKKRGDRVFVITGRPTTDQEGLTELVERTFDVELAAPVVFTGKQGKQSFIKKRELNVYYGDSDGDMRAAQAADCRPIRVRRSSLSTYPFEAHPGKFDEEILGE